MTNADYIDTQTKLTIAAALLADLPLDEFIAQAARAEAIAPIVDPGAYLAGGESLNAILNIARAARAFQRVVLAERSRLSSRSSSGPATA